MRSSPAGRSQVTWHILFASFAELRVLRETRLRDLGGTIPRKTTAWVQLPIRSRTAPSANPRSPLGPGTGTFLAKGAKFTRRARRRRGRQRSSSCPRSASARMAPAGWSQVTWHELSASARSLRSLREIAVLAAAPRSRKGRAVEPGDCPQLIGRRGRIFPRRRALGRASSVHATRRRTQRSPRRSGLQR